MKKSIYVLLLGMLMTACSEDSDLALINESMQKDPAAQLAEDFFLSVHPDKTRTSNKGFVVDAIERQIYHAVGDTVLPVEVTRAAIDDSLAFEIQTITFHTGDQQGYAVVSDDERLKTVYYFTENGQLVDTAEIAPLKEIIDSVPLYARQEIGKQYLKNVTRGIIGNYPQGSIVSTRWSWEWPFNLYAKACNCNICSNNKYQGHNPIGHANVAVAQLIAHCGKFTGTYYGNKNINFASLYPDKSYYANQSNSDTAVVRIAQFFHEIALCTQTQFDCAGTRTHPKAVYRYLCDLGYNCTYAEESSVNHNRIVQEITNNLPHFIASSSYAWLITGVKTEGNYDYYFCNWGNNGESDGWSISHPFMRPNPNGLTDYITYSAPFSSIYINSLN